MSMTAPLPEHTDQPSWLMRLRYTPLSDLLRGQVSGRLSAACLIAEADLPAALQPLISTVVRRTRLWQSEKREVARELIAHFQDGVEAGASPAELVGSFGDPRQVAKLIRRAKKRNRPLPWRAMRNAVRGTTALIALLFVLYLALAARFLIGWPNPSVDYRPQLNAAALAVPTADRAWPLYREALLQLPKGPDDLPGTPAFVGARPGEEGWADFERYVSDNAAAIALVRQAASKPGLGYLADYRIDPADAALWPDQARNAQQSPADEMGVFGILLPHLGNLRKLARILDWDAQRAADAGAGAAALADWQAMIGIARHVRETPFLFNDLVALAIFSQMLRSAGDVLAIRPAVFSDAQLRELAHRIAACDDRFCSVRLDSQRLGFADRLQRVYTDDGHGDGRITWHGLRTLSMGMRVTDDRNPWRDLEALKALASPAIGAMMLSRRETLAEYDRLLNLAITEAGTPLWSRGESRFEAEIVAIMDSPIERMRKAVLFSTTSALSQFTVEPELVRTARDGMLVALALELHRRARGEWPAALDELVPSRLPQIPPDRFDGKPLKYAQIDGKPVVYSVGTDRDDDGGTPPTYFNGVIDNNAARRWFPLERVQEAKRHAPDFSYGGASVFPPEGDWILWPPVDEQAPRP